MRSLLERGSDDTSWGSWEWFQDGRAKGFAAGVASQREADAALIEAAESQVHVLLTEGEEFSAGQLAYNICQWLAEQIRRQQ